MWRQRVAGLFLAAAVFAASPAAAYQVFEVGGDGACDFTSIQAAVNAAATAPGTDGIIIARNITYTAQHIVVQDQSVIIQGGYEDCGDFDVENELTTINGAGNGGAAVFAFRGNASVLLSNLFIRGANRSGDADGGGIDYAGSADLTIQKSTISLNSAGYGAGINFRGTGGQAVLTILNDVLVLNNTAQTSGGGIRVEGSADLRIDSPQTYIAFNHALDGYGGGVEVIGPAQASISSPGYNGAGVISFNDAARGGGLSVNAGPDNENEAYAHLFTSDPQQPVQISNNSASLTGGGIYVQPNVVFDLSGYHPQAATLCASQFRIDDNIASTGSAIHTDTDDYNLGLDDIGGDVRLYTDPASCPGIPGSPPAVACAQGLECNTLDRNVAEDTSGQPTQGATMLLWKESFLRIYGLHMRDNVAAQMLRLDDTDADVRNALIANNSAEGDLILIQTEGDYGLTLRGTTIADNAIGGSVVRTGNDIELGNLIIAQPFVPAFSVDEFPQGFFEYIVSSNSGGLPVQPNILQATPSFVDGLSRNYRLAFGSPGMDFAPAAGAYDLDGNPRDVDLAGVPNAFGPRDVGAYESQLGCVAQADTIFCDGFDE